MLSSGHSHGAVAIGVLLVSLKFSVKEMLGRVPRQLTTIAVLSDALNLAPAGVFIVTRRPVARRTQGAALDKMDWTVEEAQAVGEFSLGYA